MPDVTTTYLQMTAAAQLRPRRSNEREFVIREETAHHWQRNRSLYLLVGEPWGWVDKQRWSEEEWQNYVATDHLRTFVAFCKDSVAGYYELRRDESNAVEIAYFGLARGFIGRGLGGPLLTHALEEAWAWGAERVWVHTCTLDHPAALQNYQDRGMRIYDQQTKHLA
jgi:GNAT superfamily N-acetyltransferase